MAKDTHWTWGCHVSIFENHSSVPNLDRQRGSGSGDPEATLRKPRLCERFSTLLNGLEEPGPQRTHLLWMLLSELTALNLVKTEKVRNSQCKLAP